MKIERPGVALYEVLFLFKKKSIIEFFIKIIYIIIIYI